MDIFAFLHFILKFHVVGIKIEVALSWFLVGWNFLPKKSRQHTKNIDDQEQSSELSERTQARQLSWKSIVGSTLSYGLSRGKAIHLTALTA